MTALHQLPDHLDATVIPRALRWRYRILVLTFPLAWALGTVGYLHYPHGPGRANLSNALYHAAQLFLLHAPHFEGPLPWALEAGRWLAALSTGWVLYQARSSGFSRRTPRAALPPEGGTPNVILPEH